MLPVFCLQAIAALQPVACASTMPVEGGTQLTAQTATENALLYAYPLLAFQTRYNSLVPLIGVNKLGHARQLSTSQARATVRPNADTVYSTALFDVSQHDVYIDIPAVPDDQYALFSFHDPYGNTFAILGQENVPGSGTFYVTHDAVTTTPNESHRTRIASPITFGTFMIRWLFKDDNLSTIHSLQNATALRPILRQPQVQLDSGLDYLPLTSINWSSEDSRSPAQNALRLLCEVGAMNTPGRLAGATVQEVLRTSGYCAPNSTVPVVDIDAADRNVLAELKSAGQTSLSKRNNGWSLIPNNIAGNFGENYGLRAQISFTGYLMLTAPAALYPSWSIDSTGPPLEGDMLELDSGESYVYTFSGKPPLGKLGFWSLTVYDAKGYLIDNPRNVYYH